MKKLDSFITRAALRRILSELEKRNRPPLPDAPRTRLNVLNTGLMLDIDAARRIAFSRIIQEIKRNISRQ